MTITPRLRDATSADEEFLFSVYASSRDREFDETARSTPQIQMFLRSQFTLQDIHYKANYPNGEWKIVIENRTKIGRFYFEWQPDQLSLIDLAILPSHRGRSYGSFLIKRILQKAAKRNVPAKLNVERTNTAAQKLYRRLGFTEQGSSGFHLQMQWQTKI